MRLVLGSDHAGFELKQRLVTDLRNWGQDVRDVGTNDATPVDYPDYAEAVGAVVTQAQAERGILICGSGVGAVVAANKLRGIRAGLCHDTYSAHQGVEHDDMNVLVLGARVIGYELARELAHSFVNARFEGAERHRRRLDKIAAIENRSAGEALKSSTGDKPS